MKKVVANSSNVKAIELKEEQKEIIVQFKNGSYRYKEVKPETFEKFSQLVKDEKENKVVSWGKAVISLLKGKYESERMKEDE